MRLSSHYLYERQLEGLQSLKLQTDINSSEWLRKMIDYCFQERVLNELAPFFSGFISVNKES
jgi:hypothetical protein